MNLQNSNDNNNSFDVRILTNKDTPSVIKIWEECFTQDIDYINAFISLCFPYSINWGVFPKNSNNAVAMLTLMPSYIITKNSAGEQKKVNGAYVYGVGTLKTHRGNGYSSILMREVFTYSTNKSLEYILVKPAEESLFNLYQRQSFNHILSCYRVEIDLHPILSLNSSTVLSENSTQNKVNNHLKARESLAATNFLWPTRILNYSLLEIESRNGVTHHLNCNSNTIESLFYSAYPTDSNVTTIKIADHNARTNFELDCIIDNISTHFPFATKAIIEFPTTIGKLLLNQQMSEPKVIKNALIKVLTSDKTIINSLLNKQLTLSME